MSTSPATVLEWDLDTDAEIVVQVQIADDNYVDAGNCITIRDEGNRGIVNVYLSSVDELIEVLQAARAAAASAGRNA